MKTFLFYDLETTGLSKPFDQILQFAAIRTDPDFRELERHEFRIRLNRDVFPAPEALLTHRLGIHDIQQGMSEYDAIQKIHALLNTPQTISLGYNTLGFDDEFLRFSFYRNLLRPYTHQYQDGCGRMDIYPVTLMYYLFHESTLAWPVLEGKVSLKLENLNAANRFFEGQAHDAMTDVEVTLQLARTLAKEEAMWKYLEAGFNKKTDLERMRPLQQDIALLIRGRVGAEDRFQCPVLFIGEHQHYRNQTVWLRLDTDRLQETTPDTLADTTRTLSKKPGEPDFLLPLTPRFCKHLTEDRLARARENLQWLNAHPTLFDAIKHHHLNFKWPAWPETDWEARLYLDGFRTSSEDQFCRKFHAASLPAEKAALAERAPNESLQQLAARIIARCFPDAMTATLQDIYSPFSEALLSESQTLTPIDHQGRKRLTPKDAASIIRSLCDAPQRTLEDLKLLKEYAEWLEK